MQPRRPIWWAIIALVTVDLLFFSGASNYLPSPQSRILNQLILLGVGGGAAIAAVRGRLDLRSPLLLPGLAVVGASALATLTSLRPEASLEALALLLLAAPAYLVVRAISWDAWFRPRLEWLIVAAGLTFAAAYLLQAVTQWIAFWSVAGLAVPPLRPGDVGLTVGTVNAVSLYLELLVPIGVALAWTRWRSRRGLVLFGGLSLMALLITGSRGAWLGVAVGAVIGAILWFAHAPARPRVGRVGRGKAALVAVGAIAVAVVAAPTLAARLTDGDAGRFELWDAAWSMFTANPLTGVGPGAWPGLRSTTTITDGGYAVLYTAHSSVLQVLAELGIVGAAAVAWLAGAVALLGRRSILAASIDAERRTRVVVLATLAAVAVHSLVDTQVHIPGVVLGLMLLVARLDPPGATADVAVGGRRWASGLAIGVPVLAGAALLAPIDIAMVRAELGNHHLDRGETTAALADFDSAVALHDLPIYRLGQAIARTAELDRDRALASLARVEDREPFTFVLSAEASILGWQWQSEALQPLLTRVEAAGGYDPTAMLQVAILRSRWDDGRLSRAAVDLATVMAVVPSLIHSTPPADVFKDGTWTAAQHEALTKLTETDPATAAAEGILAGLVDDAAVARARITDPDQLALLDILGAIGDGRAADIERAMGILRANATSQPIQYLVWQIGFAARSQPTIDAVGRLSGVVFAGPPQPPMEIVLDGAANADWSLRLPRYPHAAASRLGPARPYLPGLATIEPVYRPNR